MERRIAELKEQPLLRVHRARLRRRDAKCAGIEALCATQEATVPQAARLGRAQQAHIHHGLKDPARCWHAAHGVAARRLQL